MLKQRVLFYLPVLSSGGIEKVTLHLAKGLAQWFEIGILGQAATSATLLSKDSLPQGIRLFRAPADIRALKHSRLLDQAFRLRKVLAEFHPDVIISHYPRTHLAVGLMLIFLKVRKRPKWIACEHGEPGQYLGTSPFRATLKLFLLRRLVRADKYVAVSEHVARKAAVLYPRACFQVIYNPVVFHDMFALSQKVPEHPWFHEEKPLILSMGRLGKAKGFEDLLRAFYLIRRSADARLVILGEGAEYDNLRTLARQLEIDNHLWMPGFVKNPYQYLARATVFAFPSYSEGLPLAVVEAMALGTPIVAYDIDAIREVCGPDCARVVATGAVEKLAEALLSLLRSKEEREELARKGKRRAWEMFSVEKSVEAYRRLIEEVACEATPSLRLAGGQKGREP